MTTQPNSFRNQPDERGPFGQCGGRYVAETLMPLILSGGLTADNVADGIAALKPYAVDVASGVEAAPGVKDFEKLAAFFAAVESAHVA